jgi:hypothetical protein
MHFEPDGLAFDYTGGICSIMGQGHPTPNEPNLARLQVHLFEIWNKGRSVPPWKANNGYNLVQSSVGLTAVVS